jgi:hypothetical protein
MQVGMTPLMRYIEKLKKDASLVDLQFHHLPLQERAKKRKAFENAIEMKQHEISKLSVTPFERPLPDDESCRFAVL